MNNTITSQDGKTKAAAIGTNVIVPGDTYTLGDEIKPARRFWCDDANLASTYKVDLVNDGIAPQEGIETTGQSLKENNAHVTKVHVDSPTTTGFELWK